MPFHGSHSRTRSGVLCTKKETVIDAAWQREITHLRWEEYILGSCLFGLPFVGPHPSTRGRHDMIIHDSHMLAPDPTSPMNPAPQIQMLLAQVTMPLG